MKFSEVIGQQEVKKRLIQMVDENRIPHALLFCGPSGAGKMALAMAFASYLLGDNDDANPHTQAMLKKWEHPDLHFTYPIIRPKNTTSDHRMISDDFTTEWHQLISNGPYFNLNEWMKYMNAENQQAQIFEGESDNLIHKLSLKSSQGGYKINIMWMAEKMNTKFANKILKLIEEPPTLTLFILVCEEPERLLETIRSRTQIIDVKKIENLDIEQALISQRGIEPDVAHRIARIANGNWIRALDELDSSSENKLFLDMFIMLMRLAYKRDIHELKRWSENVAGYGRESQKRMLSYFSRMARENFIYNFRTPELNYMNQNEENFAKNFSRFVNEANIIEISELIARSQRDIIQNANSRMVFFDFALKMIVLLKQE